MAIWNLHDTLVALVAPPVADRRRRHATRPAAPASSFFLIRSTGSARADAADVPPATERIALRRRPRRALRPHRRTQPVLGTFADSRAGRRVALRLSRPRQPSCRPLARR